MNLHFYTFLESIEQLEKGETITVWNKSEANDTDIHISINTAEHRISRSEMHTEGTYFLVERKDKHFRKLK